MKTNKKSNKKYYSINGAPMTVTTNDHKHFTDSFKGSSLEVEEITHEEFKKLTAESKRTSYIPNQKC